MFRFCAPRASLASLARALARSTAFASSLSRKRLFDGSWATLGRSWVLLNVLFLSVDLLCDRCRTGLFYRPFRGCIAPLASLARSLRSRNLNESVQKAFATLPKRPENLPKIYAKSLQNSSLKGHFECFRDYFGCPKTFQNLCQNLPKFRSGGSFLVSFWTSGRLPT